MHVKLNTVLFLSLSLSLSLSHTHTHTAQEVLFGLLGKDIAFSFTGKLQQLKLCEDSLYEL